MTVAIDELRDQFQDLKTREQDVLDHPDQENDYIRAWAELLFALLRLLAQDDQEYVDRLDFARESFMATIDRPLRRVIYWQHLLAGWLAFALPEEDVYDLPASIWEGPWTAEVPDA